MRIMHSADLHYCERHLTEADKCFRAAIDIAIKNECDMAVIAGDVFDSRVDLHSKAARASIRAFRVLGNAMPTLMMYGTTSHDPPGCLDVFGQLYTTRPIHIVDRICQVAYFKEGDVWMESEGWTFSEIPAHPDYKTRVPSAVFSCLVPVNKGALAAAVGAENAATAAGDVVADLLRGWGVINAKLADAGIPTILVGHGTVNGCLTEHGVPMAGQDHEMSVGALFAAGTAATILGHIHKHQSWTDPDGRKIAYSGSPGRLHYGEEGDKGVVIWDIAQDRADFTFHATPAKELMHIQCDGPPDMDELAAHAAVAERTGAHVRIRYSVDEEAKDSIDKDAIHKLFAGVPDMKLEGTIIPIQRQRAVGITQAASVADMLRTWCGVTDTDPGPVVERLALIEQGGTPVEISEEMT